MATAETIVARLRSVFGERLKMIAEFGSERHICAVVDTLTADDLDVCARTLGGKNPPLLMTRQELSRALDAFPLEFNEILSTRRLIYGSDELAGLRVQPDDVRRACEAQARGHLLHLREAYLEAGGNKKAVGRIVDASAVPFRALLENLARLDGTTVAELASRLGFSHSATKASGGNGQPFPATLTAAQRLVDYIDQWTRA